MNMGYVNTARTLDWSAYGTFAAANGTTTLTDYMD